MAPFRLELTADPGPLPIDTHVTVFYQGKPVESGRGHEDFEVMHPERQSKNVDVCCRLGAPTKGVLPPVVCGPEAPDAGRRVEAGPASSEGGPHRESGAGMGGSTSVEGGTDASHDAAVSIRDAAKSEAGSSDDSGGAPDGGTPVAILCELWTNGPAEVVVTGAKYPELDRLLAVQRDECGPTTRDVHLIWSKHDAGM